MKINPFGTYILFSSRMIFAIAHNNLGSNGTEFQKKVKKNEIIERFIESRSEMKARIKSEKIFFIAFE